MRFSVLLVEAFLFVLFCSGSTQAAVVCKEVHGMASSEHRSFMECVISTESGLILRSYKNERDFGFLNGMLTDPTVMQFVGNDRPYSIEESFEVIKYCETHSKFTTKAELDSSESIVFPGMFLIYRDVTISSQEVLDDTSFLGEHPPVGFAMIDPSWGKDNVELTGLFRTEDTGQGLGPKSGLALIDQYIPFLKEKGVPVSSIHAVSSPANRPSWITLDRLGFSHLSMPPNQEEFFGPSGTQIISEEIIGEKTRSVGIRIGLGGRQNSRWFFEMRL